MNMKICAGEHPMREGQEYYVINPEGGYGMPELLCCTECIHKPELTGLKSRMIEAGATELE